MNRHHFIFLVILLLSCAKGWAIEKNPEYILIDKEILFDTQQKEEKQKRIDFEEKIVIIVI